jgi:hypothetical protein
MATIKPLHIVRGKTLSLVIRWEQRTPIISKAITAISFATGFPRLTVASHGIPDGWRSAVVRVAAPKEINSKNDIPRTSDLRETTVIDANTIEYNGLVPVTDGRDWAAYTTGGFVQYHTPKDLTDYEIRVKVKDHVGGTVLLSTELGDAPLNLITAVADNATKSIAIEIDCANETLNETLTWNKGAWEVEGESSTGTVESIIAPSPVTVGDEVITP